MLSWTQNEVAPGKLVEFVTSIPSRGNEDGWAYYLMLSRNCFSVNRHAGRRIAVVVLKGIDRTEIIPSLSLASSSSYEVGLSCK